MIAGFRIASVVLVLTGLVPVATTPVSAAPVAVTFDVSGAFSGASLDVTVPAGVTFSAVIDREAGTITDGDLSPVSGSVTSGADSVDVLIDDGEGTTVGTISPDGSVTLTADISVVVSGTILGSPISCSFVAEDVVFTSNSSFDGALVGGSISASGFDIALTTVIVQCLPIASLIGTSGDAQFTLARDVAPSAPRNVALTPQNAALRVAWAAPLSVGSAPVTGYQIQVRPAGGSFTTAGTSTASPFTVTGLTNGRSYSVRVRALNDAGPGAWSAIRTATPFTTPGRPRSVSVTPRTDGLRVTWMAPASNGGSPITGYRVDVDPSDKSCRVGPTERSCRINGLVTGRAYTVEVSARNAAGRGPIVTVGPFRPL